jgi:LemA protein
MKGQFWVIGVIVIALIVLAGVAIFFGLYNTFVGLDVNAQNKWADVQAQYQRRADLIPAVVNATKGYMVFEKSVLEDVTNARSQWQNAKTTDDQINAGTALDSAISRLLLVYENYPQLKSDTVVRDLMVQLEGTENRIAVARMDYNDAVRAFNTGIRVFPNNIVAGMTGFTSKKEFFEATNASQTAPNVNITI